MKPYNCLRCGEMFWGVGSYCMSCLDKMKQNYGQEKERNVKSYQVRLTCGHEVTVWNENYMGMRCYCSICKGYFYVSGLVTVKTPVQEGTIVRLACNCLITTNPNYKWEFCPTHKKMSAVMWQVTYVEKKTPVKKYSYKTTSKNTQIYYCADTAQFIQVREIEEDGAWCSDFTTFYSDASTNICRKWIPMKDLKRLYPMPDNKSPFDFKVNGVSVVFISDIGAYRTIPKAVLNNGGFPYDVIYNNKTFDKYYIEDYIKFYRRWRDGKSLIDLMNEVKKADSNAGIK